MNATQKTSDNIHLFTMDKYDRIPLNVRVCEIMKRGNYIKYPYKLAHPRIELCLSTGLDIEEFFFSEYPPVDVRPYFVKQLPRSQTSSFLTRFELAFLPSHYVPFDCSVDDQLADVKFKPLEGDYDYALGEVMTIMVSEEQSLVCRIYFVVTVFRETREDTTVYRWKIYKCFNPHVELLVYK